MIRIIIAIVLSTLINLSAIAEDKYDKSLLIGDWCYKSITKGPIEPKSINTDWVFFDDGKVEFQSEWMRNNKSKTKYQFENDRIKIPAMDRKYEVNKLTNSEMLLIEVRGKSKNLFIRGKCD